MSQARLLIFALVTFLVGGCGLPSQGTPPEESSVAAESVRASPSLNVLTVEGAREAHRRAELRRHLRYMEAIKPGSVLRATARDVDQARIDAGEVSLATLYETGRLLFEHEYSFADGLGSGTVATEARSPFRRVHEGRFGGPGTTTCTSCHWRGGLAGAGALQDNSFLYGDGDTASSADPRNPPPLQGVGVAQLVAQEMTEELQAMRDRLVNEARETRRDVSAELISKGVRFGTLRVSSNGEVNASEVEGIDPDLVVKPFGWKGTFVTLREFVSESLQIHFGIQSEDLLHAHRHNPVPELVGSGSETDPDRDGIESELSTGQLTALVSFLAMQEMPVVRPPETLHDFAPAAENVLAPTATVFVDEWSRGRELFAQLGCSTCHTPMLVLKDPVFRTRSKVTGEALEIDLSKDGDHPRLQYDSRLDGYPVWMFSDMKRHDLGPQNASRHIDHGVPRSHYLTRRLWGMANSPPYFYDGHAPWLDHAIDAHGGEADESARAFAGLDYEDKGALRIYLLSLRRARRVIVP